MERNYILEGSVFAAIARGLRACLSACVCECLYSLCVLLCYVGGGVLVSMIISEFMLKNIWFATSYWDVLELSR